MYRDDTASWSTYYIGSNYIEVEAYLYTGGTLQAMLADARSAGYGYYDSDEEMLFRMLADQLYSGYYSDFVSIGATPIQESYTVTPHGTTWWETDIWGGYDEGNHNILDLVLDFHMEGNAAFAVYVSARTYGSDFNSYSSAYNRFLSDSGWLYTIPDSLDLTRVY